MRILNICCIFLALGLSACASQDLTPVEVKIPVPVPCKINPPDKPAFAVDSLPLHAGIWDDMLALRAERLQRKGYELELESAIKSCQ